MESKIENIKTIRFLAEIKNIKENKIKSEYFDIVQDPNNELILYFLIKRLDGDFKNGIYLGKLLLDQNYPFIAPKIIMLTPNGRFDLEREIYFGEYWSALWTIDKLLFALIGSLLDNDHGIGFMHDSKEKRIKLANESIEYNKSKYPDIIKLFES